MSTTDLLTAAQLTRRVARTRLPPRALRALEDAAGFLDRGNLDRAAELIRGVLETRLSDGQRTALGCVLDILDNQHEAWFDQALREDADFRAFHLDRRGRQ
jgi:hypothetical protein